MTNLFNLHLLRVPIKAKLCNFSIKPVLLKATSIINLGQMLISAFGKHQM